MTIVWTCYIIFQSTLPVWGATLTRSKAGREYLEFQSTLPVWGATLRPGMWYLSWSISIHAPRVGSDNSATLFPVLQSISIHAPRVGSDNDGLSVRYNIKISIHAPRVGSDYSSATRSKP